MIGANGSFLGKQELLRRGMAGLVDEREATRELEEQWAALERLGKKPALLDGHNHAHLCPGIAEAVLKVVPAGSWVRLGAHRLTAHPPPQPPPDLELPPDPYSSREALAVVLRKLAARAWHLGWSSYRAAARFEGLSLPRGYGAADLMALLGSISVQQDTADDVVELMTHPGEPTGSSVPFSSSQDRAREVEALTDPRLLDFVKERGIRLASFGGVR